jgi:hypothetical protein
MYIISCRLILYFLSAQLSEYSRSVLHRGKGNSSYFLLPSCEEVVWEQGPSAIFKQIAIFCTLSQKAGFKQIFKKHVILSWKYAYKTAKPKNM